jgi:hypothetical protein
LQKQNSQDYNLAQTSNKYQKHAAYDFALEFDVLYQARKAAAWGVA